MEYDKEVIGKNIQSERIKLGLSREELGRRIHTSSKQIYCYEKGNPVPPIDNLINLCSIFNCELGYLLGDPDYSSKTSARTTTIKETGLDDSAIDSIRLITGLEKKNNLSIIYNPGPSIDTLNSLLSNPGFKKLILRLNALDNAQKALQEPFNRIEKKYGPEKLSEAFDIFEKSTDYMFDKTLPTPTPEQREIIALIEDAIEEQQELQKNITLARYSLSRCFEAMVEEMYPRGRWE